jgi:hypothetical protein
MRRTSEPRWSEQVRMLQRLAPMALAKGCIDYCLMGPQCVDCDKHPERPSVFCEKALKEQPKRGELC